MHLSVPTDRSLWSIILRLHHHMFLEGKFDFKGFLFLEGVSKSSRGCSAFSTFIFLKCILLTAKIFLYQNAHIKLLSH